MSDHSKDSDCTLDSISVCVECGTYHGDPCPTCGGRGYHKAGCELYQNSYFQEVRNDTNIL